MHYFTYLTSEPSADIFRVRKAGFQKETGTHSTTTAGFPYCHAIVGLVVMMFDQSWVYPAFCSSIPCSISRLILIKPWPPKQQKKVVGETVLTLKDLRQCSAFFKINFNLTTGRPYSRPQGRPIPRFVYTRKTQWWNGIFSHGSLRFWVHSIYPTSARLWKSLWMMRCLFVIERTGFQISLRFLIFQYFVGTNWVILIVT